MSAADSGRGWAVAALAFNATVWGLSWWPLRQLQAAGLHALWATGAVFLIAVLLLAWREPQALGQVLRSRPLLALLLAAGLTNACFNWAVSIGDVLRVVLLFYLMPLWAVGLGWALLGEKPTARDLLRVLLALGGAVLVLLPEGGTAPDAAAPAALGLPELLGVAGGFGFALNNVLLRREAAATPGARGMAMFLGGLLVGSGLALALGLLGQVPAPPAPWPLPGWLPLALLLALAFSASNMALQHGAARLPASVTAVIMLSEVPIAALSAVALGEQALSPGLLGGGGLILLAALLSIAPTAPAEPAA